MQVGILGSFEVRTDDGILADVPGARLRALLIALALEPGRVVGRGFAERALASPQDLAAFAWLVGEAGRRCREPLRVVPHSDIRPAGHDHATVCPGDPIREWIAASQSQPGR